MQRLLILSVLLGAVFGNENFVGYGCGEERISGGGMKWLSPSWCLEETDTRHHSGTAGWGRQAGQGRAGLGRVQLLLDTERIKL